MPRLIIDNTSVEVPNGSSVLEAARSLGIEIPVLCHLAGYEPETSCMVCLVRNVQEDRLIPSCAAPAADGMVIDTQSDAVVTARRQALELLLGEHVGDCEAPCRRACPAFPDIPRMIRQIAAGEIEEAVRTVKAHNPFPALMGTICPAPCEKACRRAEVARLDPNRGKDGGENSGGEQAAANSEQAAAISEQAVGIRLLERYIGEAALDRANRSETNRSETSQAVKNRSDRKKNIAIVGAGLTGLSAAYYLLQRGYACTIFERRNMHGGAVRDTMPEKHLPLLDAEIRAIHDLGMQFVPDTEIGAGGEAGAQSLHGLIESHDAVVLAVGSVGARSAASLGLGKLGIGTTARGISVDPVTLETARKGVFAGGDAVKPTRLAVRAIAAGRVLAGSVNRRIEKRRFDSRIGRIRVDEVEQLRGDASGEPRTTVGSGSQPDRGYTEKEARSETGRCLNCDCRKSTSCMLRLYADDYLAETRPFKGEDRRSVTRLALPFGVVFEQAKCIKCGRCVKLTRHLPYGFTFTGRGYDMEVSIPFGRTDLAAPPDLEAVLVRCVDSCPTAALAFTISPETRRPRLGLLGAARPSRLLGSGKISILLSVHPR